MLAILKNFDNILLKIVLWKVETLFRNKLICWVGVCWNINLLLECVWQKSMDWRYRRYIKRIGLYIWEMCQTAKEQESSVFDYYVTVDSLYRCTTKFNSPLDAWHFKNTLCFEVLEPKLQFDNNVNTVLRFTAKNCKFN